MSFVRSRVLIRQLVHRVSLVHPPAIGRSLLVSSTRGVSGYGANPPSNPKSRAVEEEVPGGEVPEYSGPSITEKKSGKPENIQRTHGKKMKSNMEAEFNDSLYEEPRGMSSNGSDWDGKIHQSGSYRSLQDSEHDTTGKPKKKSTRLTNGGKKNVGESKRSITSTTPMRVDWDQHDDSVHQDKEARRVKQLNDAKIKVEDAAMNLKESAQGVWSKAKKVGRRAKETIKQSANEAMTPVYSDQNPIDDLYPTSDSEGGRKGVKLPMSSPDTAAQASGEVLGEDVDALRKNVMEGPQDMPQGVGKRAVNEKGEPMETGTRGS